MNCLHCGSAHWQLMPLVYQSGTSQVNLTHVASVAPYQAQTFGVQQTDLAANCAPPRPPSPMPPLVAFALGAFVAHASWSDYGSVQWKGMFIGAGLLAVGGLLSMVWYRGALAYSRDKQVWQSTWLCLSCGHRQQTS